MLHIYIVSLQQDLEKRKIISKTLEDFGLKFSFVDAIYGKELSEHTLDSFRKKSVGGLVDRGYPVTAPEIGCTLSHLKTHQKILDDNLKWACILEDDAILDERFKTFITTFQDVGLDPKTLYLLGGQNGLDQKHVIKSIRNTRSIGGQKFSKTIKSEAHIYRACCYLMSSYLAGDILKLYEKSFPMSDDWNYLSKNNVINGIYLSNFVDHPLDLSKSHLEKGRLLGRSSKRSNDTHHKISLLVRVKRAIKWRLDVLPLKLYRYIEPKDKK